MRIMLKSKIHRARITSTNLFYEGSISIDEELMRQADILEGEKVEILNLNNGLRTETYAIKGKKGEISLNGPAARTGVVGDEIIILSYAVIREEKLHLLKPKIVYVDEQNRIKT
ncbi:MAG: aspartate 1-decarboxylase [Candidatus Omnitrophica bacterium]|nr:aspartate 1-decarboxylase [Candidatus Omnitrophota bacterium]